MSLSHQLLSYYFKVKFGKHFFYSIPTGKHVNGKELVFIPMKNLTLMLVPP